jgi:acyl-coenzyme A thioesterase PaaI-like protein
MVLALFVVGELFMGQVVEPQVFGRGTGVTPIALIAATIFWTWLWGPLGLLIATPMTVCLAVLGRHVEGLGFLDVLLGDEPALTPQQRFYQRALTGDAAEATYHAELCLKEQSLASYLDTVALAGLKLAERDAGRGALDEAQSERVAATVKEMLENLDEFEPHRWFGKLRRKPENGKNGKEAKDGEGRLASLDATANGDEEGGKPPVVERSELAPGWVVDEPILSIGGRSPLDEATAAILAEVLNKRGLATKALPAEAISAGHIASLANTEAKLVCLSYLGLGAGPALIRYVVRRLRRILPEGTLILVCYWNEEGNKAATKAMLETAEADAYAITLPEAVELCVKAAKGELKRDKAEDIEAASAPDQPSDDKPKPRAPRRKPQSAAA